LLFSGKNVLNQKTELQRALEKQKERQTVAAQNEINKDCSNNSSLHGELGKVIMERAQKLEGKTKGVGDSPGHNVNADLNDEYLKARAKLRGCSDFKFN